MVNGIPRHEAALASKSRSAGPPDSIPASENGRFYPALDGLRAAAVTLVFAGHYFLWMFPPLSWGWAGVDIFFVLSGFLITGILYDTRNDPHRARNFYMRRTLRIFPLYYGVLLVALILTPITHWMWNGAWVLWAFYLGNYARFFYLHSPLLALGAVEHLRATFSSHPGLTAFTGHFWSLCVEEQFYLFWPLVVFSVRTRETLRTICLLSLPLVLLLRIACVWLVPNDLLQAAFLNRITPLRMDAFLLGGLVALCLRGPEASRVQNLARPMLLVLATGFVGFQLVARYLNGVWYSPSESGSLLSTLGYTLIDLFAAALILLCITLDNPLARFFNLPPLRFLGRISYGFYVFHDLFHFAYIVIGRRSAHHPFLVASLVAYPTSIFIAYISFRFYETPFLRLKRRFARP